MKEVTKELISQNMFSVKVNFLFFHTVMNLFVLMKIILFYRSTVCVEALAKCETIPPLKRAMNLRDDLIYPCCETFSTIFQGHHDSLVKQVIIQAQCGKTRNLLSQK